MASSSSRAPKQWSLSKHETVTSFESWRQNLLYTLALGSNFAPFLLDDAKWEKKTRTSTYRGLTDDGEEVDAGLRQTKSSKTKIARTYAWPNRQLLSDYRKKLNRQKLYLPWILFGNSYGNISAFSRQGAHIIDFNDIHLAPEERPEDLYQRLMAFVEDSLLRKEGGITHHDVAMTEDEEMSPTLENFIILTWLRLINPNLPRLVKQRYRTELRTRTLASIKPEISQVMSSLLDELQSTEEVKGLRTTLSLLHTGTQSRQFAPSQTLRKPDQRGYNSRNPKCCPLCQLAGRAHDHFLSKCQFLPTQDRKYMAKLLTYLTMKVMITRNPYHVTHHRKWLRRDHTIQTIQNRTPHRHSLLLIG